MADGGKLVPRGKIRTIRAADLFCGAGGTSTGAMRAARELGLKMQLVAVNHWDIAIATHTKMHPDAKHLCADLEHVRPRQAVPGGVLDILMASPTCTYHSRARGGRPVNDQQRMDPWHIVRWATDLRVHRILIENVPEMVDWGPCDVRTGRPIKSRKGEYFRAWLAALQAIGFKTDWRVINCADLGDPTTRQRFFLIGRSDKKKLKWPDPTHVKGGATDLLGTRAPWRSAKQDVIDWSIQGKSIFNRKKPLKPNTIRRILAGAKRYGWSHLHIDALQALLDGTEPVLDVSAAEASPFIVQFRGTSPDQLDAANRAITEPVATVTAGGGHQALVMATGAGGAARQVDQPIPTVTAGGDGGARPHLIEPLLMGVGNSNAAKPVTEPLPTITTGGASSEHRPGNARPQLIEPIIVSKHGGPWNTARGVDSPLFTLSTAGAGGLAEPILMRAGHGGDALKNPGAHVMKPDAPLPAQTGGGEFAIAQPLVAPYYGGGSGLTSQPATEPLPAVTTKARFGVAEPIVFPATHHGEGRVRSADDPLPTVTGANRGELMLAKPLIVSTSHSSSPGVPRSAEDPLRTITTAKGGDMGVAEAIVLRGNVGTGRTGDMRSAAEPLQTVTCSESLALSAPFLVPNLGEREGQGPRTHGVDEPLPTVTAHGHIQIAQPQVSGARIDILYRMLHWRELARAMSFDDEGEVYQFAGNATQITKQIGNAVPGRTAKALIRALLED